MAIWYWYVSTRFDIFYYAIKDAIRNEDYRPTTIAYGSIILTLHRNFAS